MTSSKVAGTRLNSSGQYVPTINGVDISPTSFDESRAVRIAEEQIASGEVKAKAQESYNIFRKTEAGNHAFCIGDKMKHHDDPPAMIHDLLLCFFEDWFTNYRPIDGVTFESIKKEITGIFKERYGND